MAVIKAVSSHAGIGTAIDYVTKDEKTEEKLMSGIHCQPETATEEMQTTKELWNKTGGRTYKHFVQSFAPEEKIDPEQAHKIAKELAGQIPAWKGHEVLIATHKDREHIHTHFIVNSVNYEDGHKLQWSKQDLRNMKERSDDLCREYELHITEKGKTFDGKDREDVTAYQKDTYQLLKNAEQGKVKSYVQDTALAVLDCKEVATSRNDFINRMNEKGYGVDWQDNHKYITYTDLARQSAGEKACKVRNNKLEKYYNMDFGKEGMEREFEVNARRTEQAREQLNRPTDTENIGIGTGFKAEEQGIDRLAELRRGLEETDRKAEPREQEDSRAERAKEQLDRTANAKNIGVGADFERSGAGYRGNEEMEIFERQAKSREQLSGITQRETESRKSEIDQLADRADRAVDQASRKANEASRGTQSRESEVKQRKPEFEQREQSRERAEAQRRAEAERARKFEAQREIERERSRGFEMER